MFLIYVALFYLTLIFLLKILVNPTKKRYLNACLIGKTCLITGGNRGLGLELALNLASRGCRVIVTCRSNGTQTKEKIIKQTNNNNIEVKYLDLTSLNSIRKLAKDLNETEERLDILINNAGVGIFHEKTEDNIHAVMQTNHFGPFLLTHLLAGLLSTDFRLGNYRNFTDLLKKSAPSRVVFVSSLLALYSYMSLDDLNPTPNPLLPLLKCIGIYNNTKLCNVISAQIFAEKLKEYNVSCNAVHPGLVKTEIFWQGQKVGLSKLSLQIIYTFIINLLSKTTEDGIQEILHCAISKDMEDVTGKFLWDRGILRSPARAKDAEFCGELWKISEELVKLQPNEKL